jgi:hypothetical protein
MMTPAVIVWAGASLATIAAPIAIAAQIAAFLLGAETLEIDRLC